MKIKFKRSYKKLDKNGKLFTMFVYIVNGTEEQLAQYKTDMGDNLVIDEETGDVLHFSRDRFVGAVNTLAQTATGKYFADMSKFDQAASLSAQYGGNFGQELARQAAVNLMGTIGAEPVSSPVAKVESVEKL